MPRDTMTLSEFINQSIDTLVDEFMAFIPDAKPRTEREWWLEFLAFVGMRQNFPHVPVVPTDLGTEQSR